MKHYSKNYLGLKKIDQHKNYSNVQNVDIQVMPMKTPPR